MRYIPRDIDLADISHTARIKLALTLYEVLVERLYKAALRGLSHLIIKERDIVNEIEKVVRPPLRSSFQSPQHLQDISH